MIARSTLSVLFMDYERRKRFFCTLVGSGKVSRRSRLGAPERAEVQLEAEEGGHQTKPLSQHAAINLTRHHLTRSLRLSEVGCRTRSNAPARALLV